MLYLQLNQRSDQGESTTDLPNDDRFTIGRRGDVPTDIGRAASGIQATVMRTDSGWDVHDGDVANDRPSANGIYDRGGARCTVIPLAEVGDIAHLVYPPGSGSRCDIAVVDGEPTDIVDRSPTLALTEFRSDIQALQVASQTQQDQIDALICRADAVDEQIKRAIEIEANLDSHLNRIEASIADLKTQVKDSQGRDTNQDTEIKKASTAIKAMGAMLIVVAVVLFADSKHRDEFADIAPELIIGLVGAAGVSSQMLPKKN